jgi:RNA ligase
LHIDSILDPWTLVHALNAGLVRRQEHPTLPLDIYNYTNACQIGHKWNYVTRTCRGLIVNRHAGEVIARPFRKFFNYGEESSGLDPWNSLDSLVRVTDKMDGSLGILYQAEPGEYAVATRGSFNSDQALHATETWLTRYADQFTPPDGKTLLFEIVYPANRIVVDYGDLDDLVLLGGVDIATGSSFGPDAVDDWPGPRAKVFPYKTFREALSAPPRPNAEGLVVHFIRSDLRLKLKQADYVALHRIVFGLNERVVWEHMKTNADVDALVSALPEEFESWVNDVADRLFGQWFVMDSEVESTFWALEDAGLTDPGSRKEFALAIKDKPAWLKSCLFLALDGKNYTGLIWKQLDPGAANTPHNTKGAVTPSE